MQEKNDASVAAFKDKFVANYGGGNMQSVGAIPWDTILAALMSLLGGCLPTNVKSQVNRPLVKARMRLRLLANGVPLRDASRVIAATVATVEAATDEDIAGWLAAASENE